MVPVRPGALYIGSIRPGSRNQGDNYQLPWSNGALGEPANLRPVINAPDIHDTTPCVPPDESYIIIFGSTGSGGVGGIDLNISTDVQRLMNSPGNGVRDNYRSDIYRTRLPALLEWARRNRHPCDGPPGAEVYGCTTPPYSTFRQARCPMFKAAVCTSVLFVAGVSSATAQLISIRTVPVSQAHQFAIFPSRTVGMAGISIAIADSLIDPFRNPGMGVRMSSTRFFGSPSAFSVTSNAGGGRTLPVGALTRAQSWYGGLWLALQEIDLSPRPGLTRELIARCVNCDLVLGPQAVEPGPADRSQGNSYAFALLGKELRPGLSLGGSMLYSRLNAIDGVDLLYAGSARIDQFGHALDFRLGLVQEFSGDRTLEAIALHNRFGTTHDVFYLDPIWDPGTQQFTQRTRLEHNQDRTRTWGLHLEYDAPLTNTGWRGGVLATINRMDHPKIPNYEIMNIPRDPGNSSAFNIGAGLSRVYQGTTFGVELIYEPIWSHTWADAATPIQSRSGRTIPAGGMTIENRFRFQNGQLRIGLAQEFALDQSGLLGGFQLGLALRSVHYWLDQQDHVQVTSRQHEENWTERMPTWGLNLRFPQLEVRYHGTVTHGTGRPGVAQNRGVFLERDVAAVGSNILIAPSGPLTLDGVRVTTHQISFSLPIH